MIKTPFDYAGNFLRRHVPEEPGRYAMPFVIGVLTLLVVISLVSTLLTRDFAIDVRDNIVDSCNTSGNSIRATVRSLLEEDIAEAKEEIFQSQNFPKSYFPGIPSDKFDELIAQGVDRNEKKITKKEKQIEANAPVNCEDRYPQP
jgi:hypothetical protein